MVSKKLKKKVVKLISDDLCHEKIGREVGLSERTLARFVTYMRTRWASEEKLHCATGYSREWAERFAEGREYSASDLTGQKVLRKMDSDEEDTDK